MVDRDNLPITDFVVIGVILIFTGVLFFRSYSSHAIDPNLLLSPEAVAEMIREEVKDTPLDDAFNPHTFSGKIKMAYFQSINNLSQQKVFNSFLHFMNKNKGILEDCSACTTEESCGEENQTAFSYPVDLTLQALQTKITQIPHLMIVDVRDIEDYLSYHIPSSVNFPLFDLPNQIFTTDRWTEIVVVGDSYWQTKLAGESLIRLNFHRVHRLMVPIEKWDQVWESLA
jgi:rhodanese-related sulfurtransferase